jgi:sugar lactone lactonase YvrE
LALSSTYGGANVDITGLNPGDSNHTLRYYNPNFNGHNLVKYASEFANNQRILYRVPTSNTVISGLANNTAYYVVGANTVGFQVSATRGGANINITAAGTGESHNFSTVAGFLPGDFVYQSTTPVMNASIQSIFSNTTGDYVRVSGNTQEINVTSSNTLLSYTNPYVTANVSSATLFQIISSAKGIIKSANTTVARIKRLSFENTFVSGSLLIGDVSGVSANVIGVAEDSDVLYPIGLNASIEANVITATGQITSLQVIDSGVGYSNGDIVQYTSEDGARSGSIKIINDGNGIGKGYYKSSKGFLSEDMYVHDGDYYQEYSYEILSKISVDRYSDMFKKVMHTAGTKFFGSALIVEEANVALSLTEISTGQEIQFNSNSSINNTNETINTGALNPFANGDLVMYTTSNTVVEANVSVTFNSNTGVSNGFISIVDNVIPSGHRVKYIPTSYDNLIGGIATSFNSNTAVSNGVITLTNNIYENGDAVNYYVSTGNTAVPGLQNAQTYYVSSSSGNNITLSLSPDYVYTDLTNTSLVQVGSYSILIESLPELNPTGVFFKPDGARMYIIGSNKDVIREYNLSTPWAVNTATFVAQTTFPTSVVGWGETSPTGLYISSDGVYIYAVGSTIDRIQQLTMSTPWSVNTAALGASFDANAAIFAITGVNAGITGVTFKPEGDKVYVIDSDNDRIYQFNLSVPWDISTATLYGNTSSSSSPGIGDSVARGLYFIPDGKKCYTVGTTSDRISTINLSTAWDITTAASSSSVNQFFVFDPPYQSNASFSPNDIFIKPDLSRVYITEAGNSAGSTSKVIEYNWYTTVPSSISETGHNLVKEYFYTSANTSGFKLKAQYNDAPLSFNAITASETQTIKIYELQNNFSYYIVGTASNTIKLSLTPSGSPINITANGTHSGAATAGHYLTKTVEE